jgi:uncharacterized membrane protein YdjX (TVP38/TMEM64 family)
MIGAIAAISLSPVRGWLSDTLRVKQTISQMGLWTYPVCGLFAAVLTATGFPRLILCGLSAMLFGFWPGLLILHLASILGYYATFLFVRWGGRDWVLGKWPKLSGWARIVGDQGTMGVILARQLPLHGALINFCLGISHVKHRDLLIGTFFGLIPEAIPASLVGAGLVEPHGHVMARYMALAAVGFAIIWIYCGLMMRKLRRAAAAMPKGEGLEI